MLCRLDNRDSKKIFFRKIVIFCMKLNLISHVELWAYTYYQLLIKKLNKILNTSLISSLWIRVFSFYQLNVNVYIILCIKSSIFIMHVIILLKHMIGKLFIFDLGQIIFLKTFSIFNNVEYKGGVKQ
jgi:hypothetical protein